MMYRTSAPSLMTHFPFLGQILLLLGFSWRNDWWRRQGTRLVTRAKPHGHGEPGSTEDTRHAIPGTAILYVHNLALWSSVSCVTI